MKNLFPGFYRPTSEDIESAWSHCTFIFDANVLLNLYRYPVKARDDLLEVLTNISPRVWLPYQAALEFQNNRLSVMLEQSNRFHEVRKISRELVSNATKKLNEALPRNRHSLIDQSNFIESINQAVEDFEYLLNNLEQKQPKINDIDYIRGRIDAVFDHRIGSPPEKIWIEKLYQEASIRYADKRPPGFRDFSKQDGDDTIVCYGEISYKKKFGDFVLWKQIIDFSKAKNKKHIVFVTDDLKDDWYWIISGKKIGPRPELIEEIHREAGVDLFNICSTHQFLKHSHEFLKTEVDQDTIDQIKDVLSISNNNKIRTDTVTEAVERWVRKRDGVTTVSRSFFQDMIGHHDLIGPVGYHIVNISRYDEIDTMMLPVLKAAIQDINNEKLEGSVIVVVSGLADDMISRIENLAKLFFTKSSGRMSIEIGAIAIDAASLEVEFQPHTRIESSASEGLKRVEIW